MNKSYGFLIAVAVLIFIVFGIYFPILARYQSLKNQEEEMDVKIASMDQKIKELTEERDLLKNDRDYLEKVIRKELGLVKPGEVIYKFVSEPPASAPAPESSASPEAVKTVQQAGIPTQASMPPQAPASEPVSAQ